MLVASQFSYGAGRVQHGLFQYEAAAAGGGQSPQKFTFAHVACFVCLLFLAIVGPSASEMLAGHWLKSATCDKPLAMWLTLDGSSTLTVAAVQILIIGRVLCSEGEGDEQIAQQEMHESEHGTVVAAFGQRRKQLSRCEMYIMSKIHWPLIALLVLTFIGWLWSNSVVLCDETLANVTHDMLVCKLLIVVLLCCCGPCFLAWGMAILPVLTPEVGRPDDASP